MSYISIQCYATNPVSIKFTIFPAKQPPRVFVVDIPDTQNGTEIAVKHLRDDLLKAFSPRVEDAELLSKLVVTATNEAELRHQPPRAGTWPCRRAVSLSHVRQRTWLALHDS